MSTSSVRSRAAAVLVACVAVCALQAPAAFAANVPVSLTTNKTFSPATVNVALGDTVTWTWAESRSHNVTANAGQADTFSSANRSSGTFQKIFNVAGSFTYQCTLHGGMTGTVNVSGGTSPPPPPDTTAPGAPTSVIAAAADATVTLDWADSAATDLQNYVVQRRIGTGAFATIAAPAVSAYTDVTVTNGVTYGYRIRAVDATGNVSTNSAIVTATPAAPPPTTGPATRHVSIANYVFGPTTITVNTGDTVTWDWNGADLNHSVTTTGGQAVSFDSHLGLADNQITGAPAGGFSRVFSQVGNITYFCRIHTDMTGTVNVVTPPATPDTAAPGTPAIPVATAAEASLTIDWADSSAPDVANYVVQRQAGTGSWSTVAQPVGSLFIDTAVVAGTTYSYRVMAVDVAGNQSSASAVVSAALVVAPPAPQVDAGPVTRRVSIANYVYAPATITVNSGDTVAWDWNGIDLNHSVSSLPGPAESFDSHLGALLSAILGPPAGGYSHVFTQVGSFPYLCRVHPDMTGTVQVVASGAPATQPETAPTPAPKPAAAQIATPARDAKTHAVKVADFVYSPANLSIAAGDVVRWSWTGEDRNHSVTSAAGSSESYESHPGLKISEVTKAPTGGSFSRAFAKEGTFAYFCRVHPDMKGKITVGAAPLRVRIVSVKRGSGSLRVSYRLTKTSTVKAQVFRGDKRVVTKSAKGRGGANTMQIALPRSARRAALKVVLRGGPDARVMARATVRAVPRR
jgi:plastocyanin